MRVIAQEHGPEFGGHMGRVIELAQQAERESEVARASAFLNLYSQSMTYSF